LSTGLDYLHQAAADFSEMGLDFDHASCLVALGNGLLQLGKADSARKAWQDALTLNQETVPAITWRIRDGLARLAESVGDSQEALAQYRLAMKALNRQRRDFWQPDLAGTFLQKASALVDRAVDCAFNNGSGEDVLQFIEAGKAQTVARRLLRSLDTTLYRTVPEALKTAAVEINNLYEQLNARHEKSTTFYDPVIDDLMSRLHQKIEAYRIGRSQWEREHKQDIDLPSEDQLDIGRFSQAAEKRLAGSWMAVSYYLTEDYLYVVALIDGVCQSWKQLITPNAWVALESCIRARTNRSKPTAEELAVLGQWLIPEEVAKKLTEDTILLLVPHRELHQVPWGALLIGKEPHPLVTTSIPVIVPALFCLSLLWQRETVPPHRANGLLVGASEFPGRHKRPLPQVNTEMNRIAAHLGNRGRVLVGKDATWNNVRALAGQNGLARFSFCHIAGHASFDSLTGRLSGISFYDRDVWLDELWECAPWPHLLTMAACNGSQSLVHEGDEHVGLTTTFLSAGANTVAGSIWPVRDEDAANLLTSFYDHYLDGIQPSKALALVQREAVRQGQKISRWGSFICVGQP
jgi:tetratricopeptide (TPR) repeat protein